MAGGKMIAICGAAALLALGMSTLAKAESTEVDSGGFAIQGEEFPTPDMSPELTEKAPIKAARHAVPDASDGASLGSGNGQSTAGVGLTAPAAPEPEGSR